MNQNNSEELKHYGVLGMKWGKRKAQYYEERAKVAKAKAKEYKGLVGEYEYKKKADRAVAKATRYRTKADNYADKYYTLKDAKQREKIANNDKRVTQYGKRQVQAADAISIATTAYGAHVGRKVIKSVGMSAMKAIAENPNIGNGALHVASALTIAGMGAVTVNQIKRTYQLSEDIALAQKYDERKQLRKK